MGLFTKKDLDWLTAHGLKRPEGNIGKVDFCEGDIGPLHVEARLFKNSQYEVTITNTATGTWMTGRGDTLKKARNNAVDILLGRQEDIRSLIDLVKDWEGEK